MMNTHKLELPLFRTNFHGPKGVRAIEIRLYLFQTVNLGNLELLYPKLTCYIKDYIGHNPNLNSFVSVDLYQIIAI